MDDEDTEDYSFEQKEAVLYEMNVLFSQYKDHPDLKTIHVSRLLEVLQAFGRNPSYTDCERRIRELEEEEKFELTLEDFLQLLEESWTLANSEREVLRRAFSKFDHSKHGFLDIEQFRTAMRTLGEPLTDDEINELIQLGLNDEQRKIDIERLLDHLLGRDD